MKRGTLPSHTLPVSALLGITEVHDLSFAYQVGPLLRLLSAETHLSGDLLHARAWLTELESAGQLLDTLLEQEWSGFLARLGRVGPWVFAPTVADLQALSAAYTTVVEMAYQSDLQGSSPSSLLGRLRASGEFSGQVGSLQAEEAERAFWTLAGTSAARQRAEWAARRR